MGHTIQCTSPPTIPAPTPRPARGPSRPTSDTARASRRHREISPEAVVLLRMAQAGDRDAFAEIFRAYADTVRRYVAARLGAHDRDAVPDLVQDTFCAALVELDHAHDDVRGWLVQLAAKMCTRYTWAQRRYLRAALTIGEHQRIHLTASPVHPPSGATQSLIAQALAELDPDERLTLQLRFLDGLPQPTTAALMHCSRWTVRQTQKRALQRLAARLTTQPSNPCRLAATGQPAPDGHSPPG